MESLVWKAPSTGFTSIVCKWTFDTESMGRREMKSRARNTLSVFPSSFWYFANDRYPLRRHCFTQHKHLPLASSHLATLFSVFLVNSGSSVSHKYIFSLNISLRKTKPILAISPYFGGEFLSKGRLWRWLRSILTKKTNTCDFLFVTERIRVLEASCRKILKRYWESCSSEIWVVV